MSPYVYFVVPRDWSDHMTSFAHITPVLLLRANFTFFRDDVKGNFQFVPHTNGAFPDFDRSDSIAALP